MFSVGFTQPRDAEESRQSPETKNKKQNAPRKRRLSGSWCCNHVVSSEAFKLSALILVQDVAATISVIANTGAMLDIGQERSMK
jgi:hypothetical protein